MAHQHELSTSSIVYPPLVDIPGIGNTHTHPRDTDRENDGRAELHIPLLADVYEYALGMGNTVPPLTNIELARAKAAQWRRIIPAGKPLDLYVAGLMTERTDPKEVVAGYDCPPGKEAWIAIKMFMRAVSNAHGADVDDISKVIPVIRAMTHTKFKHRQGPMPLSIHAERKYNPIGKRINFLDRDAASMHRDIPRIFAEVPEARVIVCHVKSAYAVEAIRYYRSKGYDIWGEIASHYSMYCCDDLFEGPDGSTMFNTNLFCLPIFGTEEDRRAIENAMLSGEPFWFFGEDEACWLDDPSKEKGVKINSRGFVTGGQTHIPEAVISYLIEKFAEAGKLELLPAFLSHNGRRALNLPPSTITTRFRYEEWATPEIISRTSPTLGKLHARVATAGMKRRYKVESIGV